MNTRAIVFPVLLFAFATWAVYLGGLAAVQRYCTDGTTGTPGADIAAQAVPNNLNTNGLSGVFGFSGNVLFCNNVYRFHWFIAAFQFLVIVGALIAAAVPHGINMTRGFWVGMFAVATLLFMIASEAFLAAISSSSNATGNRLTAHRATAAGAILTTVANIFALFAVGSDLTRRRDYHDRKEYGTGVTGPAGTTTATTTGATAV